MISSFPFACSAILRAWPKATSLAEEKSDGWKITKFRPTWFGIDDILSIKFLLRLGRRRSRRQIISDQRSKYLSIPPLCGRDLKWPAPRALDNGRPAARVQSCCRAARRENPCDLGS